MPSARPPSTPTPEKSFGSKCSCSDTGGIFAGTITGMLSVWNPFTGRSSSGSGCAAGRSGVGAISTSVVS